MTLPAFPWHAVTRMLCSISRLSILEICPLLTFERSENGSYHFLTTYRNEQRRESKKVPNARGLGTVIKDGKWYSWAKCHKNVRNINSVNLRLSNNEFIECEERTNILTDFHKAYKVKAPYLRGVLYFVYRLSPHLWRGLKKMCDK